MFEKQAGVGAAIWCLKSEVRSEKGSRFCSRRVPHVQLSWDTSQPMLGSNSDLWRSSCWTCELFGAVWRCFEAPVLEVKNITWHGSLVVKWWLWPRNSSDILTKISLETHVFKYCNMISFLMNNRRISRSLICRCFRNMTTSQSSKHSTCVRRCGTDLAKICWGHARTRVLFSKLRCLKLRYVALREYTT